MKRFAILGLVLVLGAAAFYLVNDRLNLGIGKKHYVFNQKITLTFDTPNGPVVASNVGQLEWLFQSDRLWDPKSGNRYFYDGEALVANLGDGKYVFLLSPKSTILGLLIVDHNEWTPFHPREPMQAVGHLWRRQGEVWDIPTELLPDLVTFLDIDDENTFEYLNPENVGAVLGDGYSLSSATFQVTSDPITVGQVQPLLDPWITRAFQPGARADVLKDPVADGSIPQIVLSEFFRGQLMKNLIESYKY